jgi:hypothetical protein
MGDTIALLLLIIGVVWAALMVNQEGNDDDS